MMCVTMQGRWPGWTRRSPFGATRAQWTHGASTCCPPCWCTNQPSASLRSSPCHTRTSTISTRASTPLAEHHMRRQPNTTQQLYPAAAMLVAGRYVTHIPRTAGASCQVWLYSDINYNPTLYKESYFRIPRGIRVKFESLTTAPELACNGSCHIHPHLSGLA